jgi:hypothetical protein
VRGQYQRPSRRKNCYVGGGVQDFDAIKLMKFAAS